jgi:hypothetical protein
MKRSVPDSLLWKMQNARVVDFVSFLWEEIDKGLSPFTLSLDPA